jgi:hypothetical protein
MSQRVLTPEELAEINKISRQFAKEIRKQLANQINSLDLRSQAEVFERIKSRNQVDVHLAESFKTRIKRRFGQVDSIHWSYNWYGLFHDVGTPTLPATNWSDKVVTPRLKMFENRLVQFYTNVAVDAIIFTKSKTA